MSLPSRCILWLLALLAIGSGTSSARLVPHGARLSPPGTVPSSAVPLRSGSDSGVLGFQESEREVGEEEPPMPTPAEAYDFSSWAWWWQLNREPYLDLRAMAW